MGGGRRGKFPWMSFSSILRGRGKFPPEDLAILTIWREKKNEKVCPEGGKNHTMEGEK